MRRQLRIVVLSLVGLGMGSAALTPALAIAAPASGRVVLQRQSPAATPANEAGGVKD